MDIGLDRNTPNFILTEELKYKDTSIKALRRILNYEQETRKEVIDCIKEIELNRVTEEKNTWVRDRKNLLDRYGIGRPERDRIREESEGEIKRTIRVLMKRVEQKEREGRRRKLGDNQDTIANMRK